VDAETVATHHSALDLSLREEHGPVKLHLMTNRNHSDDSSGATGLNRLEALLGQFGNADSFECVINSSTGPEPLDHRRLFWPFAGQLANSFHRVGIGRVNRVRRAEPFRHRQL